MMRFLLAGAAICLMLTPVFAQTAAPTPLMPVMVVATPVIGVVTIVVERGQFYTDLGAVEQLPCGSGLLIQRNGVVIATARVIKVNELDSVAELLPGSRNVVLMAGDKAIVQDCPTPAGQVALSSQRSYSRSHRLPYIEPNMSQASAETFFTVASLVVIGLVIANN